MNGFIETGKLFAYIYKLLHSKTIFKLSSTCLFEFIPHALVRANKKTIKIYKIGKFSYLQLHEEGKLKLVNVIRSSVESSGAE